jgi:hypothetical protein
MSETIELLSGAIALLGVAGCFAAWIGHRLARRTARPAPMRERVGPYVLLERIASGAMGEVYRARHAGSGRSSCSRPPRTPSPFSITDRHRTACATSPWSFFVVPASRT